MIRVKTGNRREGNFFRLHWNMYLSENYRKTRWGGERKYAFCLQHLLSITTKPSENERITRKKKIGWYLQLLVLVRPVPPCCGTVCVDRGGGSADEEQVRLEDALRRRCCWCCGKAALHRRRQTGCLAAGFLPAGSPTPLIQTASSSPSC